MRALILGALAIISAACSPRITEPDLAKRVETSVVRWNNYQEDVKAQIGAAPTAEWNGAPAAARREGNVVTITFALDGPWKTRNVGIPVLIRDPLGNVVRESSNSPASAGTEYHFTLDPSWAASPVPWVELQFPRNETRIVFREDGTWQSHR